MTDEDQRERARANAALRQLKFVAASEMLGMSEDATNRLLLHRAIAGIPRHPYERYLLRRLDAVRCERVSDDIVRIDLRRGRTFFGHRSEQAEYVLHHLLKGRIPAVVSGDGYKLAVDVHSRYIEGTLPWYFGAPGVYVEGGCYTGLKAIRWSEALGPDSRVLAVEIGSSNHAILCMNIDANDLRGRIVPIHAGLWGASGTGTQRHTFTTKRFLESSDRWQESLVHEEQVRLLSLDDLLDEQEVEVAEYLNVQVNGAEVEVLGGLIEMRRFKVIDVAAYYGKSGIRNVDVVREMLTSRGCFVLAESRAGRLAVATPDHVDEVMARRPGR